ncbi:ribosome recycling factor [Candidatus Peribacteria bacterium RIFCSPLOWO2_02_FULL_51_10]|nr:MAG: ribosome recycling factor [Candidatus Peribacteria bacterium RIFCSPHIGHO2_02_FULL_51_15]OGJ68045.1 MAG: ribosome recycling factor [Candidatus Peribacteria bacterium RIFCSPLOWO2_02_FULL_51_10]
MHHPALLSFDQLTKKTLDHLHQEFSKLQTGRANATLIEHIPVEAYGQKMELKAVSSISVQDARSMVIQPWDRSVLGAVEKALIQANIGVNPVNDGVVIRLNFPQMTEERRVQMKKIVSQLSEQAKIKIRQDRQAANDQIKTLADEDEKERLQKDLQKMVDDSNHKIEESAKKKEGEVMTI